MAIVFFNYASQAFRRRIKNMAHARLNGKPVVVWANGQIQGL
jgi:hypothetical protein